MTNSEVIISIILVVALCFLFYLMGSGEKQDKLLYDYCTSSGYVDFAYVKNVPYCVSGDEFKRIEWYE